jgi:hypothetical protein
MMQTFIQNETSKKKTYFLIFIFNYFYEAGLWQLMKKIQLITINLRCIKAKFDISK